MITSTANSQVKQAAALAKRARARRESGLFLVEGEKMVAELPKEKFYKAYVSESFLKHRKGRAEELLEGRPFETVSDEVMKAMSDTQTPQGILALCRQFSYSLPDLLKGERAHLIFLETIQDPGNLGTIIRAGEGAGVTGVIMNSSTADIYNPKVIRSTMGSVYRVPFVYTEELGAAVRQAKEAGITVCAAHLKGAKSYDKEDYRKPSAFLIGNEAGGLTEETAALADCCIRIPMAGQVESLNAAVAASVLMYEAARQRRGKL